MYREDPDLDPMTHSSDRTEPGKGLAIVAASAAVSLLALVAAWVLL